MRVQGEEGQWKSDEEPFKHVEMLWNVPVFKSGCISIFYINNQSIMSSALQSFAALKLQIWDKAWSDIIMIIQTSIVSYPDKDCILIHDGDGISMSENVL